MAYHEHRLKIFVSYSHKDDELRKKLTVQLRALKYADVWDDRVIGAGKEWHEEIISEVESADIILLLISSDFLASDYVNQVEIKKAFERHHAKTARVIPVLLAHCLWEHHEEISKLQAFPPDGKWVTAKKHWDSEAEALMSVVKGIEDAAKELREERQRQHDKQKTDEDTYRKKVAEMLSDDDRISEIERDILEDVRIDLKLSKEQASAIEAGELQPIEEKKKNIEKYEKTLKKTLERKGYPFGEAVQKDLEKVRGHLGLGPDDAVGVEKRVVGRWESERMVKEEADQMAKEDAERKAKEETERMAKEDAERTAKEDAERKAKEETERKTKEETERKAKEEADRKAKEEAERKAKEKADRKAKEEAEGKAKEQAEEAKALARVQGLQAFLLTWNAGEVNVLVAPDIPEKKLNNAIPRYEVPPTELVIGLIDATVFGSAKEGLIFGSQGVYFKILTGLDHMPSRIPLFHPATSTSMATT